MYHVIQRRTEDRLKTLALPGGRVRLLYNSLTLLMLLFDALLMLLYNSIKEIIGCCDEQIRPPSLFLSEYILAYRAETSSLFVPRSRLEDAFHFTQLSKYKFRVLAPVKETAAKAGKEKKAA